MSDTRESPPSLDLKPREIAVGAIAALITAFASSVLGVAGTIGGAAVGSVLTTISGSLLRHSAERTNERLRSSNSQLRRMVSRCTGWDLSPGEPRPARPAEPVAVGTSTMDRPAARRPVDAFGLPPAWSTVDSSGHGRSPAPASRQRRWWVVVGATVAMFVLAIGGITSAEALIGEPLSSLFGHHNHSGSSISQVVGGKSADAGKTGRDKPAPPRSSTGSGTDASTAPPATSAPAGGTDTGTPAPPAGGGAGGDTGAPDPGAAGTGAAATGAAGDAAGGGG
jgi:hypothetical protein